MRRLALVVFMLGSLLFNSGAYAKKDPNSEPTDDTVVVVVQDISDVGCTMGYGSADDTPETVKTSPCQPGMAMTSFYAKYSEVKKLQKEGKHLKYFSDTGDKNENSKIAEQKGDELKSELQANKNRLKAQMFLQLLRV